jgi:hypothetical protein
VSTATGCGTTELPGTHLVETALEAAFAASAVVPLLVDDAECNILIGRAGDETDEAGVVLAGRSKGLATSAAVLTFNLVRGGLCFVDEVGIEYVEFVALDDLGRRVVVVIVGLVVLVPLVAHLHTVEVSGLPRLVRAGPLWLCTGDLFFGRKDLLALFDAARNLTFVESHGGLRVVVLVDRGESRRADGGDALASGGVVAGGLAGRRLLGRDIAELPNLRALVGLVLGSVCVDVDRVPKA